VHNPKLCESQYCFHRNTQLRDQNLHQKLQRLLSHGKFVL